MQDVFTHQLRSQSRPGDVLVAVSSSGRSANIVTALRWARDHGLRTISLTGFDGGDGQDHRRRVHSRQRHELRRDRGPASDDHARPGPVHPAVANDAGRDLLECVLSHGGQHRCDTKAGPSDASRPAATYARGDQPPARESRQPVRCPLVLDPDDPRDGQAAEPRRGAPPAGEPEVAAPVPGIRAGCSLHHLPVVERTAHRAHPERAPLLARCACRSAASTSSTP